VGGKVLNNFDKEVLYQPPGIYLLLHYSLAPLGWEFLYLSREISRGFSSEKPLQPQTIIY